VYRGWNFKESLRNKLRFTRGWAEFLSVAHIFQILCWVAWTELFYMSHYSMCNYFVCKVSPQVIGPQVKYMYTEWLKISPLSAFRVPFRNKKRILRILKTVCNLVLVHSPAFFLCAFITRSYHQKQKSAHANNFFCIFWLKFTNIPTDKLCHSAFV
jgi:hypothetical protein